MANLNGPSEGGVSLFPIARPDIVRTLSASVGDLTGRLDEFRASHEALGPILSQLAGPLELRLMPAPTRGEGR
jgi:hypothetical protein